MPILHIDGDEMEEVFSLLRGALFQSGIDADRPAHLGRWWDEARDIG